MRKLIFSLGCLAACGGDPGSMDPSATTGIAVQTCVSAAEAMAATCGPGAPDQRGCMTARYADYCADAPDPVRFAAAIDCLHAESSLGSCRTFADPSAARDCVRAVYADVDVPGATTFARDFAALGGYADRPETFMPPVYVLDDEQLGVAQACLDGAGSLREADACLQASVQASLASCFD